MSSSKSVWSLVAGDQEVSVEPIVLTLEAAARIKQSVEEFARWRDSYKPPRYDMDMTTRYH